MNLAKATTFLKARADNSKALKRFDVAVSETPLTVEVILRPLDRSFVYAKVIVKESVAALTETGFDHRVVVRYEAREGRWQDLRNTHMAAIVAAVDLAEAVDSHLRSGL